MFVYPEWLAYISLVLGAFLMVRFIAKSSKKWLLIFGAGFLLFGFTLLFSNLINLVP